MMQASELFTLARDLAHLKVLSVYIDNRVVDPSKRGAWRADLSSRLRNMRATSRLFDREPTPVAPRAS